MAEDDQEDELDFMANFADHIKGLANGVLPIYKDFAEKVDSGLITDINIIERQLDNILGYCFDEKILVHYKKILRKIYPQHPEIVEFHIDEYYNFHKDEEVDVFLVGTSLKIKPVSKKNRYRDFLATGDTQ